MLPGQDPQLEWGSPRIRRHGHETLRLVHHPLGVGELLPDDVAVDAAALVLVVLAGLVQLAPHLVENDRNGRDARVRMGNARTWNAMPARDEQIPDREIALEITDALAVHPEH